MGRVPSQAGLTPDQIQALNQAPATPNFGTGVTQQSTPTTPWQNAIAGNVSGLPAGDMWSKLMGAIGQGAAPKMPGTTFGGPGGAMMPPPPMLPQTQMAPPRGLGPNFPLQQPAAAGAGGNNTLMAQYMALQQLMRGA